MTKAALSGSASSVIISGKTQPSLLTTLEVGNESGSGLVLHSSEQLR